MRDFKDKTAFITGGAGGFGVAFAKRLLDAGARVVLADIDAAALARAAAELGSNSRVKLVACDVALRSAVAAAAEQAISAFGPVQLVFNNAGVAGRCAGVEAYAEADWRWSLGVNLMGVVNGVSVFLPHMRSHGQGGHFINTASIAGLQGQPQWSPYSAGKAAVVSLSESLHYELKSEPIGVSVLCPGFAKTGLAQSEKLRPLGDGESAPAQSQAAAATMAEVIEAVETGMTADEVAARMMQGLCDGDLYIFTHPRMRPLLARRIARLQAAYDKADNYAAATPLPMGEGQG